MALLNHLLITSSDSSHMNRHLDQTAQNLIEQLDLNSCFIEVQISREQFSTFQGQSQCTDCSCYSGHQIIHSKHFIIPVEFNGKKIGQMKVCFKVAPDDMTIQFIYSFARQLSVIVENAELWRQVQYKEQLRLQLLERMISIQEEERKRISRELHDETSQSLTSILVGLSLIKEHEPSTHISEKILEFKRVTQNTLDELHYISWSLRPSVLDDQGLFPAIKIYVQEFMKKYQIDVDIQVIGVKEGRLPSMIEVSVYRIIQEALTNVARHAKAENVSIILKQHHQQLSIIIEDDGIGFDVERFIGKELIKEHLGLKGMQERIESIGGSFTIESMTGSGTTIYVKQIKIVEKSNETENNAG